MFLCEMGVIISPGERQLENVCLRQKKKKIMFSCLVHRQTKST